MSFSASLEQEPDEDTIEGIFYWSWNDYQAVRAGHAPELEAIIEGFVEGKSFEGTMYRGIATKKPQDYAVGDHINQKGPSSWSSRRSVVEKFSETELKPYHYIFIMEGGTRMGADISKWSAHPEEHEVTVSKNSWQEITRIEEMDGKTIVYVKEVRD